jgi:hypothetical protein
MDREKWPVIPHMNCLYPQGAETKDVSPAPDYTAVWALLVSIQSTFPVIRRSLIYSQNAHSYFQL